MRRYLVLGFVVLAVAPTRGEELVAWLPYATAVRESKARQKPILLFFTDPHCGPCRALESQVFSNPAAARTVNTGYFPVKVVLNGQKPEPRETAALARRFGVAGAPAVFIVSPAGARLHRFGWSTRTEVIGTLNRFARGEGAPRSAP